MVAEFKSEEPTCWIPGECEGIVDSVEMVTWDFECLEVYT